jgi:hypothetical protein
MSKLIEDTYLGDGVYASYDGYHIFLDLRAQDSTTRIGLEPQVLDALDHFRLQINRAEKRRKELSKEGGDQ